MPELTALFWDVGGVLLTNGWDAPARARAAQTFGYDLDAFEERHARAVEALETGRLSLNGYLDQTVFYVDRPFAREELVRFIRSCSQPHRDSLALAESIGRTRRYLMATLNNESEELNRYRIESFGLRRSFPVFFSSCYLGARKPDREIFLMALRLSARAPEECVFIDDRPANVACARSLGFRAFDYRDPERLRRELAGIGVEMGP